MEPAATVATPPAQPVNSAGVEVPNKAGNPLKKILIILFLIILLLGLGVAGFFFIIKPRFLNQKAPDCSNYSFIISDTGEVSVQNSSTQKFASQQVTINIGSAQVASLDVPEVGPNETKTIGVVTIPSGAFSWEAIGSKACKNSGNVEAETPSAASVSARCGLISAYDKNWNLLTLEDLSKITAGTIIRFTVLGTANSGTFDKARFTINGEERPEVSSKRPDSDEFYDEYIVPKGVSSFTVSAEVHHAELDAWF
jgi:hypothetical protein